MPSERRDAPRIPYSLEAVIKSGSGAPQPCKTRDISVNGVFVLIRGAGSYSPGPVELVVKMPLPRSRPIQRFHAQIVHAGADGVGLLFDHTGTEGYVPLIKLVFAKTRMPELL